MLCIILVYSYRASAIMNVVIMRHDSVDDIKTVD